LSICLTMTRNKENHLKNKHFSSSKMKYFLNLFSEKKEKFEKLSHSNQVARFWKLWSLTFVVKVSI